MINLLKASIQDLVKHAYRIAPNNDMKTVKAVVVENLFNDPIPVVVTDGIGQTDFFFFFDDAVLVPANVFTQIIEYTVPVGKSFNLGQITCSGESIAKFTVRINGANNKILRTHYGDGLNLEINYNDYEVVAGQKIEVYAEHFNIGMDSDFEATIEGKLI